MKVLFIYTLGKRPTSKHSLDRKNVNGHYEPSNCKWSTKHEQMLNRRKVKSLQMFSTEELINEINRRGLIDK